LSHNYFFKTTKSPYHETFGHESPCNPPQLFFSSTLKNKGKKQQLQAKILKEAAQLPLIYQTGKLIFRLFPCRERGERVNL